MKLDTTALLMLGAVMMVFGLIVLTATKNQHGESVFAGGLVLLALCHALTKEKP